MNKTICSVPAKIMRNVVLLLTLLFLTGCWDRQELTEMGIVTGIALDMNKETGEYILTSQFLRPASQSTVAPTPNEPFILISATGKTIPELMQKTNRNVDRNGFYPHNKVIIMSEEVAKSGVLHLFENFQREQNIRSYAWLAVAKGTSARSLLEKHKTSISSIPASFLNNLFMDANADAVSSNLLNFYKKALKKGESPVIAVLSIDEGVEMTPQTTKLSGGAVFDGDRLAGFLNERETMAYNWVKTKIRNETLGSYDFLSEDGSIVALALIDKNAKINPNVSKGSLDSFSIEVNLLTELSEHQPMKEFNENADIIHYLDNIEKQAEKKMKADIRHLTETAQKELESDILGFGDRLYKRYPSVWNKVKDNWRAHFKDLEIEVEVNVKIKNSGLIKGTLLPESM
ncbi:Ger(x)C family spore germination protein [Gracilibacillus oryzae]|uniref:Ger(X)C family spore germination protein n=1 Tax=Gracilibacillus oryzae TaxID=1672701 RepID=A0A7C8KVL3_9BACI|nr:Ger(x)C family spore germination protein [Gracilibacillus oryzae]KAB8137547.1 Ger(x)C family spore germination protein [Gracilibacillus oryzae]